MRISSARNVLFLSGISVCLLFLWSWSRVEPLTSEMHVQTFNNRKSLSLDKFQEDQRSSPPDHWQAPNWDNGATPRDIGGTRDRRPGIIKGENLPRQSDRNNSIKRGQTRVILMSYMRSGSTFTGDLFQFSPQVLYYYEPLLYTNDVDVLTKGVPVRNRLIGRFASYPNAPETQLYLESLLHCRLTVSNMEFMLGLSYSRSLKEYMLCKSRTNNGDTGLCVTNLSRRCQQSQTVIAKVLRLKMWEVDELLSRDPLLKVIHLVRDPRGIVLSRRVASYFLQVNSLCQRLAIDAELSLKLQKEYPGRLLTLRYEDLAMHPEPVTKILYDFAGIPWNDVIARQVQNITSPTDGLFQEHIFDTRRKNSTATAFNWRLKLDFESALSTQSHCHRMMSVYGYRHFKSHAEMTDLRLSSMAESYDPNLFKAQMAKNMKGRLLTLRYEDLAMHPEPVTKILYDFAGIPWNDVIARQVQNITSPTDGLFQEHIFDTRRKNSTATAFNWRLKLDFESALSTQSHCHRMMSVYGYRHFKSHAEMTDLRLSSMAESYDPNLFKAQMAKNMKGNS